MSNRYKVYMTEMRPTSLLAMMTVLHYKGPLGWGKLLPLPFLKFFYEDTLSSRDCCLDSFVNSSHPYHMQLKEPCVCYKIS